ncbi:MAG: HEAT repeat domain-containing protein [Chloroflexota bacterium]|jgi:HEAT repeat protein|nr:HEAT repeat domain-containing protein [Chloroflexota bacterium]
MIDQFKRNNNKKEEIERCLRLIQSRNPRDRSYAAKRLGELKARPDILMSLMDDPNGFVRSASAEALGRSVELPAPEVISHLLAAIDDPNNYVCAAAVNSLGLLEAEQAKEQVETCLNDPHPIVVQAAILAMARIDPDAIKDRLIEYLQSDEYLIHLAATRACGWLSYEPCGDYVLQALKNFMAVNDQQDLKLPKLYIEVLARLDKTEAIPTLVEIAENEVGLRGVAVEALVEMNAEEAAQILSPLLSDPSNRLRRNLIEMMMQADYETALPLVRPLLKDNAITVRETALAAVSQWGDKVSVEDVREIAYSDPNPFVRPQAVLTLTNLLGQEALPDLVELSDDLNLHVRRTVAQCFGEVDYLTPSAKAALIRLANEEDTAEFAREALQKHDLNAIPYIPKTEPKLKVPVPEDLRQELQALLTLLETWQESLPDLQQKFELEKLSDVDQALSTLIVYLREANNG